MVLVVLVLVVMGGVGAVLALAAVAGLIGPAEVDPLLEEAAVALAEPWAPRVPEVSLPPPGPAAAPGGVRAPAPARPAVGSSRTERELVGSAR